MSDTQYGTNEPVIFTMLMTPEMATFSGNVHGGALLKLLDQVAYTCASRYSGHYAVTLSVDQVNFRQLIKIGELVSLLIFYKLRRALLNGGRRKSRSRGYLFP